MKNEMSDYVRPDWKGIRDALVTDDARRDADTRRTNFWVRVVVAVISFTLIFGAVALLQESKTTKSWESP